MEAGSSIDSREVHSLKVEPSVIAMPSGSVISVSADAPEKVPVPESFCRLLADGWLSSSCSRIRPIPKQSPPRPPRGQSPQFLHVLQSRIENFDTARNGDLCYIFEAG